jgi:predicted transposase YbfD/YdcC
MVIPVLEALDITGKTITTDALLTQPTLATYLLDHGAHDVFTVKDNQPCWRISASVSRGSRSARLSRAPLAHVRIEQRAIWTNSVLNDYLNFPVVGQAFVIERHTVTMKTGKTSTETVYGVTSHTPATAETEGVVTFNRGHWTVENSCHYTLDWNWNEDRCTIRTGYVPLNINALRRFDIGAIMAKSRNTVAAIIQRLARNDRLVFDYLGMTENSRHRLRGRSTTAG